MARARPVLTDQVYSRGLYPWLARGLASLTARVPFSLAEAVFLAIPIVTLVAIAAGYRRARRRGGGRLLSWLGGAASGAGAAGGFWAAFVVLWGLNYARPPSEVLFGLPPAMPAREDRLRITGEIGARLDRLREALPEGAAGVVVDGEAPEELDLHLAPIQAEMLESRGLPAIREGRVKRLLSGSLALRWSAVGVYGPFTAEPSVAVPAPPGLLASSVAHERAHLSGFAREEDASFVGLLTTWRSPRPEVRYSGWLTLWLALGAPEKDRHPGVVRDVRAIREFLRSRAGRESAAAERLYDRFLKAHGARAGVRGYGRVASLAIRFLSKHGFPQS